MDSFIDVYWPIIVATVGVMMAVSASLHAALTKRDVRAAVSWAMLSWFSPYIGPILYLLFGINRIQRRAIRLKRRRADGPTPHMTESTDAAPGAVAALQPHLAPLRRLIDNVTRRELTRGNRVEPLIGGDAIYDAMLDAVARAERTIGIATYIFGNDPVGRRLADALGEAVDRGVTVKVLIDGFGARYSRPRIAGYLEERGVETAHFLESVMPWRMPYANLRNHRKLMVVDGRVGFAGGANIRASFSAAQVGDAAQRDTHFRFEGPVVAHLAEAFAEDWAFITEEILDEETWFPDLSPHDGGVLARGILSGPDRNLEATHWSLMGALSVARDRVVIATPYFLPDRQLVAALNIAATRGVEIDILLPERNNLRLVSWAAAAQLSQVLKGGCRVHFTPPPFDHSKITVVDGVWAMVGSSNWDPRSLRLNFEFDVEIYDPVLVETLTRHLAGLRHEGRAVTMAELDARNPLVRTRDAAVWLFSPYL